MPRFAVAWTRFGGYNPSFRIRDDSGANQESAMGEPVPGSQPPTRPSEDRLDSWKEIAAYLDRDVTTVQRWEKREGMPVHRHVHDKMGSVYASRAELDAWVAQRANLENGGKVSDVQAEVVDAEFFPQPSAQTRSSSISKSKVILSL